MLKLHLGCGYKDLRPFGYQNVDIRWNPCVDVQADICELPMFEPGTVDVIYCCHALQHVGRWRWRPTLIRWFDLLRPGGLLRLSVPDFEAIVTRYTRTGELAELIGLLYARQDYPENVDRMAWDFRSLSANLASIGFSEIVRYNWRLTEHASVDDFSAAYLPHMDFNGQSMSLNVEAGKPKGTT